jgi:hypothetical protein
MQRAISRGDDVMKKGDNYDCRFCGEAAIAWHANEDGSIALCWDCALAVRWRLQVLQEKGVWYSSYRKKEETGA